MNKQDFWTVFLLFVTFGVLVMAVLYVFGEIKVLIMAAVAQTLILGNFLLWQGFFSKPLFQNLIKQPLFLFFLYFLKLSFILLVLYITYQILY